MSKAAWARGGADLYLSGRKLEGEWCLGKIDEAWELTNVGGTLKKELPVEGSALPGGHIHRESPAARTRAGSAKLKPDRLLFTEPMECKPVERLPEGPEWTYEVKLDGYRAQAIRDAEGVRLLSRRNNQLSDQFPGPVRDLHTLPPGTVVDGEIVAVDEQGRPSFQLLQNRGSGQVPTIFYAFDLLWLRYECLLDRPLSERRRFLDQTIRRTQAVQISEQFTISLEQMVESVKANNLEGIVAKRLNSLYEPGQRSGAWVKQRLNRAQEFVLGGYRPGTVGFDSLLLGFYRDGELRYCASTRNGFVPATRREVFAGLRGLEVEECPFVNLPEANAGRWGAGLTAKKMSECRWVRPEVVAQFEFVEWTEGEHLRHAKYVGLRDDKDARAVVRET